MLGRVSMVAAIVSAVAGIGASTASADEVYQVYAYDDATLVDEYIYEDDVGTNAVWVSKDGSLRLYIEGLAGLYQNRSIYDGIWVEYGEGSIEPPCPDGPATDHLGNQLSHWGRLRIDWTQYGNDDATWVLFLSRCNEPMGTFGTLTSFKPR
ncbi:MAG: hypothetical protein RIC87_07355 [Kiloniellales bacterium]